MHINKNIDIKSKTNNSMINTYLLVALLIYLESQPPVLPLIALIF